MTLCNKFMKAVIIVSMAFSLNLTIPWCWWLSKNQRLCSCFASQVEPVRASSSKKNGNVEITLENAAQSLTQHKMLCDCFACSHCSVDAGYINCAALICIDQLVYGKEMEMNKREYSLSLLLCFWTNLLQLQQYISAPKWALKPVQFCIPSLRFCLLLSNYPSCREESVRFSVWGRLFF